MSGKNKRGGQSGGVSITKSNVKIGGDIVGRDKIAKYGVSGGELIKMFSQIKQQIEAIPYDPDVDKTELSDIVEKIEQEVKKGEAANPTKIERWLKFLATTSDDIFQVTVAALVNPLSGLAKAIQLIAQKVQKEK